MIIHGVYINTFGRLKDYKRTFDNGLNVICEENGSGKTTLAMFIYAMLYGLQKSKIRNLDNNPLNKYKPWFSNLTGGSLAFTFEGKKYRIERDFGHDKVKVIDLSLNKECDFGGCPGERIFGIDRNAFLRSAYIRQAAWISYSEEGNNDSLNNKLAEFTEKSGDDVGCDKALKLLDERREQLSKKSYKGDLDICRLELRELNKKISETEDEYDKVQSENAKASALSNTINKLRIQSKAAVLSNKIYLAKNTLSNAEKAESLRKEIDIIDNRLKALSEAAKGFDDMTRSISLAKEAALSDIEVKLCEADYRDAKNDFASIRDSLKEMNNEKEALLAKRREVLLRLQSVQQIMPEDNKINLEKRKSPWGKAAAFFALLTVAAFSLLLLDNIIYFVAAGGICALGCAISFWLWRKSFSQKINVDDGRAEANALINELNNKIGGEIKQIDDRLVEIDFKIQGILKKVNADNVSDALIALTQGEEKSKNISERLTSLKSKHAQFLQLNNKNIGAYKIFAASILKSNEMSPLNEIKFAEEKLSEKIAENNMSIEKLKSDKTNMLISISKFESDPQKTQALKAFYESESKNLSALNIELKEWKNSFGHEINRYDGSKETDEKEITSELVEAEKREAALSSAIRERVSRLPILADLYNERERLISKTEILEKKFYAIEAAKKCLISARDKLSHAFVPKINEEFNKLVKELSGDKINSCEIDNAFEVTVIDGGFRRELSYYSSGTKELIEFILRLSIIKAMYGEIPFLMLDDCFVNLDDDTEKKVKDMLRSISKDKQIIYFTCHKE